MGLTDAANAYGTMEQGTLDLAPRSRFNFRLEIITANDSFLFERIKSVNLPNITFDTQIANQYNQKRVIQSKINYGQCTVTFYDTYDNDFVNNIQKPYISNYYHNGKGISNSEQLYLPSVIGGFNNGEKGYTLTSPNNRYFIDKILIEILGPGDFVRFYVMKNCMITDINGDNLDYSDSNPVEITATFQPEYIDIAEGKNI